MKIVSLKESKKFIVILIAIFVFGHNINKISAQESVSVLYVPLIGITSVPEPLTLPSGAGDITYHYAVKNFLREIALTDVKVADDSCGPVKFIEGDDNSDSKLDYNETWRYACVTKLSSTTESIATATGNTQNLIAKQKAYTTVVVGSNISAPLVSITNTTKISHPLSLIEEGGDVTFTYRVNNPGVVPLRDVVVTDDICNSMSNKLGDTNGNNLLDTNEVWIYSCRTNLKQTSTSVAKVTASGNGLKAFSEATLAINVDTSGAEAPLFDVEISPARTAANDNFKIIVWGILSAILAALAIFFIFKGGQKNNEEKN